MVWAESVFISGVDRPRVRVAGAPGLYARFARHRDNSGGFLERHRRHASLHFLYIDGRELNESGMCTWICTAQWVRL
jgi:hypothetical protein